LYKSNTILVVSIVFAGKTLLLGLNISAFGFSDEYGSSRQGAAKNLTHSRLKTISWSCCRPGSTLGPGAQVPIFGHVPSYDKGSPMKAARLAGGLSYGQAPEFFGVDCLFVCLFVCVVFNVPSAQKKLFGTGIRRDEV
jgi:hypothetical protein